MHRFYCLTSLQNNKLVNLIQKDEIHHIKNVLQLKCNQSIELFNDKGQLAEGVIKHIDTTKVTISVQSVKNEAAILPSIILACAIPKKGKFETIIEKVTELGVDEIIPLHTARSEVIIKKEKQSLKLQRYQKVALNAAKQSKRTSIPIIHPMTEFKTTIEALLSRSTVLIPSLMGERKPILDQLQSFGSDPTVISILIGPEGDFTEQEYAEAHQAGCHPVTLGQTILKVETAAITAVGVTRMYFNG